jgi:hypothetical protein
MQRRRQRERLETEPPLEVYIAFAEGILLAKFEWFRLGGEASERQCAIFYAFAKRRFSISIMNIFILGVGL